MTSQTIVFLAALFVLGVMFVLEVYMGDRARTLLLSEYAAERQLLLAHLTAQRQEAQAERRVLADRIQHPQRVQVQPQADYVPPEPPRDEAELAHIGGIVPEFVQVGSAPGEGPPEEVG